MNLTARKHPTNRNIFTHGFTLIELLVVISIISFLASLTLASFNQVRMKARDARRQADIHNLERALIDYETTYGDYPPEGVLPDPVSCDTSFCYVAGDSIPGVNDGESFTWDQLKQILGFAPLDPINSLRGISYYYYQYYKTTNSSGKSILFYPACDPQTGLWTWNTSGPAGYRAVINDILETPTGNAINYLSSCPNYQPNHWDSYVDFVFLP